MSSWPRYLYEIRTPLNSFFRLGLLLRSGHGEKSETAHALDSIERSAKQIQLVEDLLDVSRIIKGQMQLKVQRVEIGDVVDAALDSIVLPLKPSQ